MAGIVTLGIVAAGAVGVGRASAQGTPSAESAAGTEAAAIWQPAPGIRWQWQLTGTIDTTVDAQAYDIDLFDAPQAVIDKLHSQGRKVICYLSAGTYENWRPDANSFPASVLGKSNGWPGERWLDIRRLDVLAPVLRARLDLARAKGCDAVEPDNVDGYDNDTGFPLSRADQLAFDRFLAEEAHRRGLSVGLKNALELVPELVGTFDWALDEQCFEYDECDALLPFIRAGKAVLGVEYALEPAQFCPRANAMGFSWLRKNPELDAWRIACN